MLLRLWVGQDNLHQSRSRGVSESIVPRRLLGYRPRFDIEAAWSDQLPRSEGHQ